MPTSLHAELRTLIASSRQRLAGAVNAELTRVYWAVGQRLATEVLGGERAQYGSQLLEQLGQQLSQEFGRGFEARDLRRMVKFAQAFPSAEIVSTQLSWSHMVVIVALKNPQARQFYAQQAAQDSWSVTVVLHKKNCLVPYLHVDPATALPVLPNARDVTNIGHWGTGNLEVTLSTQCDLDAAKPFIMAAYEGRGAAGQ